jgi:hypothetical protein
MNSVSIWNLYLFSDKSLFSRPIAKDVKNMSVERLKARWPLIAHYYRYSTKSIQNVIKRKKEISKVRAMRKTSFMLYASQKSATDRLRNRSTANDQTRQSIKFLTIRFLKSQYHLSYATEN